MVCLAIGLVFRDLETIQFAEEDGVVPDDSGDFLQNSTLSWAQADALADACAALEVVLKSCLQSLGSNNQLEQHPSTHPLPPSNSSHILQSISPAKKGKKGPTKKQAAPRFNPLPPQDISTSPAQCVLLFTIEVSCP